MNWTTDKPTEAGWTAGKAVKEAGWYWWKYKGMLSIVELRAWPNGKKLYAKGGVTVPINALELDGEFLGPITPDDRQQGRVEAFKEVEQRFDSMFGATDRRIDSVRDYRVDKFYTWLAQAAQDE